MNTRTIHLKAQQNLFNQINHYLKRQHVKNLAYRAIIYFLLIIGSFLISLPFFWMISTSLKKPGTEFTIPIQWIPNPPRWDNYLKGWSILPFNIWLFNTITITAISTIGSLLSSSVIAFGFARIDFPGRNILFLLVLATMMLPYPSVIIPLFILYKNLGWLDSFKPLTIPTFFGVNAFYIFLLRQFFKTIPKDLDDAARVDGCNTFGVFRYIALPLIKPALGIIFVFSFMYNWNDFLGPLIYLSSPEKFTLALGLRFFQSQYRVEWTLLMAVSLIVLSPCIILFFIAQKYYIQGIVITGIKG
ncbi:MAG: carbohydrate ABC transporter permease [Anaerolineae bacterium]|nr:carbohydrate ABC transporter permease [Anaerolineae bacterium]